MAICNIVKKYLHVTVSSTEHRILMFNVIITTYTKYNYKKTSTTVYDG
jgi:hypothetical protein